MDGRLPPRRVLSGVTRLPVAYLVCNFAPPVDNEPALLTHNEVQTLFHEFGHGLHHLLTMIDYLPVTGIHGVEWDAVELPSQFLENWCWSREALNLLAGHYQTGVPLPEELYQRMLAAKHFQAGILMARQLEFALFDFRLHHDYDPARGGRVREVLTRYANRWRSSRHRPITALPTPSPTFSGGYAAGYYSL